MPVNIFGLTILKKSDYEDLEDKYEEQHDDLQYAIRRSNSTRKFLEQSELYGRALVKNAEFLRENSRPVNSTNGRMMKESRWPELDEAAVAYTTKKLGLAPGQFLDLKIKFK